MFYLIYGIIITIFLILQGSASIQYFFYGITPDFLLILIIFLAVNYGRTIGGLTGLHPLVKLSLELLHHPTAKELMQIVAVAGLAQNFAALRSLTTTGIQEGHMKMHLMNILNQFEATSTEKNELIEHFKTNVVTHSAVVEAIENLRK